MIQAEDVLMGTKSSRHYAAHTSSWISIIAATSSHQSPFPPGAPALAPPGASRIRQRLRRRGRAGICHSQLLPTLHLCQDTPDQQTIKPFYKRWLQNQSAKWQQLVEKFHFLIKGSTYAFHIGTCTINSRCWGSDTGFEARCKLLFPNALTKADLYITHFRDRKMQDNLLQWIRRTTGQPRTLK